MTSGRDGREPKNTLKKDLYVTTRTQIPQRSFASHDLEKSDRETGESAAKWWARLTREEQERVKASQREHHWHPNQLRHNHATEVRQRFGLEAAQVSLGHATADVTQVYAERDLTLAVKVASEIG